MSQKILSPVVDQLENRDLQAVVSLSGGVLSLYSSSSPGGSSFVQVGYNPDNANQLAVFSDGIVSYFNANEVSELRFYSSVDGSDTFLNNTDKTSTGFLQGSNNRFVGGSANDVVVDWAINSIVRDNGGGLDYYDLA